MPNTPYVLSPSPHSVYDFFQNPLHYLIMDLMFSPHAAPSMVDIQLSILSNYHTGGNVVSVNWLTLGIQLEDVQDLLQVAVQSLGSLTATKQANILARQQKLHAKIHKHDDMAESILSGMDLDKDSLQSS
ncbi:hypothetical protein V8B97DRAFT_2004683 [Scleroderma yunnanense]